MATEKWVAGSGQGLTYGDAFTSTTLNSLGSTSAVLSDVTISNGTSLDMFCDLSLNLGSVSFAAPNFVGIYIYPLNKDGSTYGDGRFVASTAAAPPSQYFVGSIPLVAAAQAQEGTLRSIIMPPGTFKFLIYNQGGIAFSTSGNTCQYRTYNRSIT